MANAYTLVKYTPGMDIQYGSLDAENLFGTPNTDVFFGYGGDDILRGAGESDFLIGESGTDTLQGEAGDDYLFYSQEAFGFPYYFYGLNNFVGLSSAIAASGDRQFLEDEWYDVFGLNLATSTDPKTDREIDGGDGIDRLVLDLSYKTAPITFVFTAGAEFDIENIQVKRTDIAWIKGGSGADSLTGGVNADRLYGGVGDDRLDGGLGDDFVFGGAGVDTLNGGGDNDMIVATDNYAQFSRAFATDSASDYYAGLQTIFSANPFASTPDRALDGGLGNDTVVIDFRALKAGVTEVNFVLNPALRDTIDELQGGLVIENIEAIWAIGSARTDTIVGGDLDDRFLTNGGDRDSFDGRGGSNWVEMSATLVGDIDLSTGQHTGDVAGDTYTNVQNLVGSDNANILTGTSSANMLYGRGGDDRLNGGGGDDLLEGGAGQDALFGGMGVDTASYATAGTAVTADLLNAQINLGDAQGDSYSEIENLTGSRRADVLLGDNLANRIDGGLGNDRLEGRDGADTLIGGAGDDLLDGGDGLDAAVFSGNKTDYIITQTLTGFVIVDKRGANFDGTDTVTKIETFVFADQTRGANNLLSSAPSNPVLTQTAPLSEKASAGTVVGVLSALDPDGSPVNFSISGGSNQFAIVDNKLVVAQGATFDFETAPIATVNVVASDGSLTSSIVTLNVTIGDVEERILGTDAANNLVGTAADDIMLGLGGDDIFAASAGADVIDGGEGKDTLVFSSFVTFDLGTPANMTDEAKGDSYTSIEVFRFSAAGDGITGGTGADIFYAGRGNDDISGGDGNDELYGEVGADTIDGGAGNDKIIGGGGKDELTGGAGADRFIFEATSDRDDRILDFSRSEKDKIVIDLSGFKLNDSFALVNKKTLVVNDNPVAKVAGPVFLFDTDSGTLSFDSNGKTKGGISLIATLEDVATLSSSDFLLIA